MRVLVTGGSGFLGNHLIKYLREKQIDYYAPTRMEIDLRTEINLGNINPDFSHIFHLAAHTQAGDWCLTHQGEQWLINQQINTNVLDLWLKKLPMAKMVSIGTSCSYSPGIAMTENNYLEGQPIEGLLTYAMTKRMLLLGNRAMAEQFGLEYIHAIPSTLYGSGYHLDGRQMHFIFDLIRKILRGKYLNQTVELWGDGLQRRELVHVNDFIINLMCLVDKGAHGEFNLGAGQDYAIRDFAELISRLVDYDSRLITYDQTKYVGAKSKLLETVKVKSYLSEYSNRSLENGLRETIEWFTASKAYLR
jgi:GDP-L-fucose synthase